MVFQLVAVLGCCLLGVTESPPVEAPGSAPASAQPTPVAPPADSNVATVPNYNNWPSDPNRPKYFWGESALLPRPGEFRAFGWFQADSVQALFGVGVGVTRWLSIDVGTVAPLWVIGTRFPNFTVNVKTGFQLRPKWHLGGGVQSFTVYSEQWRTVGQAYVVGTYLAPRGHVSLTLSSPVALGTDVLAFIQPGIVSASGVWRAFSFMSLMTDNAFLRVGESGLLINAVGLRFIWKLLAFDVALIGVTTLTPTSTTMLAPLPWASFSRSF